MDLVRKMTLKNAQIRDWIIINICMIAGVIAILIVIFGSLIDNATKCRTRNLSSAISFYREADVKGRIHYYVTFITKNGSVCYDTEIPPGEFYRLKAINEPLAH